MHINSLLILAVEVEVFRCSVPKEVTAINIRQISGKLLAAVKAQNS